MFAITLKVVVYMSMLITFVCGKQFAGKVYVYYHKKQYFK